MPGLRPTLALLTVLSVTGSLLAFDQFFVLTHGGPDNSTVTVVLALYNKAFQSFRLGNAAAEAVVVLIVLVLVNVDPAAAVPGAGEMMSTIAPRPTDGRAGASEPGPPRRAHRRSSTASPSCSPPRSCRR